MDGRLRAVRSSAAASVEHTTALVGGVGRRRGTEPPVTRCRPAVCRNTCGSGREGPAPQALPDPGVETPDPVAGEPKHPGAGRAWFLKGDGGGSSTGGGPGADPAVERGTGPSEHADGAPTPDSKAVRVGGSSNSPGGGAGGGRGEGTRRSVPGAHGGRREPRLGGRRIRPRERRIRWGGGAGGLWRRGPGQEAAARRACEGCGPAVALTARCRVGWARICWGRRWVGVVGGRRPCEEAPPPPSLSPGGLPRGGLSGGGEEEGGREGEGAVGGGGPPGSPRGDASGAERGGHVVFI